MKLLEKYHEIKRSQKHHEIKRRQKYHEIKRSQYNMMRSREAKAFLLEPATELLFCEETLGKGPVVEDNCGVRAGIEASHGAKGTNLKKL